MYDGEIRINTKIDNKGINQGLDKTAKEMDRLTSQFDKQTQAIRKNEFALNNLNDKLKNTVEKEYNDLISKIQETNLQIEHSKDFGDIQGLEQANANLGELESRSINLATYMEDLRNNSSLTAEQIQQIILDPNTSATMRELAQKTIVTNDALQLGANNANSLKNRIQELSKEKGIQEIATNTNNASNGFEKMARRIKGLVIGALVFNVIRRSLSELTKSLGSALMNNEAFARSFNAVKVNLLTAFAPIWQAIQPALISFMNILAQVTQAVAQFIANIFGMTLAQAKDSAKALYSQAKGINAVNKAAKNATNTLDELATVSQPGEVGGGVAAAAPLDFTATIDDAKIKEQSENIKSYIKNIFDYWDNLQLGTEGNWGSFIDGLLTTIKGVYDFFKGIVQLVIGIFQVIGGLFTGNVDLIQKGYDNLISGLKNLFGGLLEFIGGIFLAILGFFKGILLDIWDGIKQNVKNIGEIFSILWQAIVDSFKNAWSKILGFMSKGGQIFSGITEGIGNIFKTMVNAIISGLNLIIKKPLDFVNGLLNVIKNLSFLGISPFKNLWSNNPIPIPQIPKLATGGIINQPTIAMIGERGKEAVMPLENNTGWITDLANQINSQNGNGNNEETNLLLERLIQVVESKNLQIGDEDVMRANDRAVANRGIVTGGGVFKNGW